MRKRGNQGSVLMTVIVVLMLVAVAVAGLTVTLQDRAQMDGKAREVTRAFYAAEAGGNEVVSWFNTSGTAITKIDASQTDFASLFLRDEWGEYTALKSKSNFHGKNGMAVSRFSKLLLPVLKSDGEGCRVSEITIYHRDWDPLKGQHPPVEDLICIVRSAGEADKGTQKVVFYYLAEWTMRIDSPAGIISKAPIDAGGNAKGHWGEVWGKIAEPPSLAQMKKDVTGDPWLRWRCEDYMIFSSTWKPGDWGDGRIIAIDPESKLEYVAGPATEPFYIKPAIGEPLDGGPYDDVFAQHQVLDWPTYDYHEAKKLARKKGRYFRTGAAGQLYVDGIMDAAHTTDVTALNIEEGTRARWAEADYDVVFVDTLDAQPPAADYSNVGKLKLTSDMFAVSGMKGFYYVCADIDFGGLPVTDISCQAPDGTSHMLKAFLDGILVIRGEANMGGNATAYGSIVADKGFSGTGTMDVYYNHRLEKGFLVPIRPDVDIAMFKVTH